MIPGERNSVERRTGDAPLPRWVTVWYSPYTCLFTPILRKSLRVRSDYTGHIHVSFAPILRKSLRDMYMSPFFVFAALRQQHGNVSPVRIEAALHEPRMNKIVSEHRME